jgi:hypothetical protein
VATTAPPARRDAAMSPTPSADALLLTGGLGADGQAFEDAWAFDGGSWSQVPIVDDTTGDLGDWGSPRIAYDRSTGEVVVAVRPTWTQASVLYIYAWTGSRWIARGTIPLPYASVALFYDEAAQRIAIVTSDNQQDGMGSSDNYYAWWYFDGDGWYVAASTALLGVPSVGPLAFAYTPAHGVLMVHSGGFDAWDGVGWTTDAATLPFGTYAPSSLAWDRVRAQAFATAYSAGAPVTLRLDGDSFVEVERGVGNLSRQLAFDDDLGAVVAIEYNQRTYEVWDDVGARWRPSIEGIAEPNLGPPVYDARRRTLLLAGTAPFQQAFAKSTAITWDGVARDACATGLDGDGDGLAGCDDPDCWASCAPLCPPGDGVRRSRRRTAATSTCSALETCAACATDCGACVGGTVRRRPLRSRRGRRRRVCPGDCGG